MKEKLKEKIDTIYMMLLILILITSSFLIRKSQYFYIMQTIILVMTVIYVIIRNFYKEPIKIIRNKLDIMVLALVGSSFIPLIFGTYASLSASIVIGLNYITLYSLYFLTSEICYRKKIGIKWINTAIIVQSILFVIIGIENLTTNRILLFLEIENITNGESRLVSLFGNPNVLASYLLFTFFIILNRTINAEKTKEKIILNICNTICMIGIILTYSKAIFLLIPIMIIIYMILIKNKETNIEVIQNIITYFIIAIIYMIIYNKIIAIENYLLVWIFLLLMLVVEALINIVNIKTKVIVENIKMRYVILVVAITMVCCITWIIIELQKTVPYDVFNNKNTSTYEAKKIYYIEGNKEYKISLDIESEASTEDNSNIEDMYTINVIERDAKNVEIKNTEIVFGNFVGTKEIDIITHENTRELKIEFKAKYQYISRKLIIKELKLNDEIITLEYENLPIKLVDKIKNINLNYKTAQERIQFIKDALKLSTENIFTGIGGEGWQYRYGEVQGYDYSSSDIHSYPAQILLEFGIIGLILLIAIYVYIVKMKIEPKYLGLKIGLIVIMIHSAIDSEMKIFYMQMLVFIYFSIFSSQKKEYQIKRKKLAICSNVLYLLIAIISIYLILNESVYILKNNMNELEERNIGVQVNSSEYIENNKKISELYEKIIKYEKNRQIEYYSKFLMAYIKSGQTEKLEEYYIKLKEYENKWKQKPAKIVEKSNGIVSVVRTLENQKNDELNEWILKFCEILIDESENISKELEQAISQKYETKEENFEYTTFKANVEYIRFIHERHILGIEISNQSDKTITKELLEGGLQIDNKNILLYHTHGTEAFYTENEYEEIEDNRTLNENYNILGVGDIFKNELEERGLKVVHLKDYNDLNGIEGAYDRSEIKVREQLKKENAQIIFDIHRDADLGIPDSNSITIDGQNVATIRFVIASGHEGWEENLKWAVAIQKKANEMYPGLFNEMLIYNNNYNQNLSKYATLIEVGYDSTTVEEANRSMEYLANILSELL